MVGRFLGWRLPDPWHPDGGVSFKRYGNEGTSHQYTNEPSGTNLLDAMQADAMVRHMIDGMPATSEVKPLCAYCGQHHTTRCPSVQAIEYFPDGTVRRVEFVQSAPLNFGIDYSRLKAGATALYGVSVNGEMPLVWNETPKQ